MFKLSRRVPPLNLGVPCRTVLITYGFSGEVIGYLVGALMATVLIPRLIGTMFAAVHHAERRRVGAARSLRT